MRDVIFHAFNCKYKDIINAVDKIHDAGYGAILIPPPLYSDKNGDQWWQRYQPKDYRVLLLKGGQNQLQGRLYKLHSS